MINEIYQGIVFQIETLVRRVRSTSAVNYLMNGKNVRVDLSAGTRSTWNFTPGKKHLLRIYNSAIDSHWKVSIDGHKMTVVSNDMVPIQPYTVDFTSISVGQRYDGIVEANKPVGKYFFGAVAATACSANLNTGNGQANGIITYTGATPNVINANATAVTTACNDEPLAGLIPIVPKPIDSSSFVAKAAALPVAVNQGRVSGGDSVFLWYINGVSMNAN